ncbi:hypothetical protein PSTG_04860 [Puccinia striiformis f. sp. tritici PST-78]|uniref:Uncharacterized protein n=1 Tax=Puccinia striiformis f. sp. tritici PST-78 TaxID=1165861 RepID=A0A0L0VRZ0_9BASI|nr:hypothetical protein PSTG_04860 [Puccinia striiformis f. sp. tritici PST-78]
MSSSPVDGIWEILEEIEAKLIQTVQQDILPQVIETTNQLINSIPTDYNPFESATNNPIQKNEILPLILPTNTKKQGNKRLFRPRNLIILAGILVSSRLAIGYITHTTYYENFIRSHPQLSIYLPRSSSRSRRRKQSHNREGERTRSELVVILGADPGTLGHQIALHLIQLGFVVIVSVSSADLVNIIESEGSGWIKGLVLDPLSPQIKIFTRSLSASLSLNFPLNSTSNGSIHQPALIGLINCIPVSLPDHHLRPVEAFNVNDHLIHRIHSVVGVSLEVVKFILPIIRNSCERFGAIDGLILTLFPTKNSSLALPFLGSSFIANQALESTMVTLRREIKISDSDSKSSIRIVNERIGTFRPSTNFGSINQAPIEENKNARSIVPSLPVHLHPIYARSMSRRIGLLGLSSGPTDHHGLGFLNSTINHKTGSPVSQLLRRIEKIMYSSRSIKIGSKVSVGGETWRYFFINRFLNERIVDSWLVLIEKVNGWMRRKVISEIDLESNESLARLVQKRNFSNQSNHNNHIWKRDISSAIINHSKPEPEEKEEEEKEIEIRIIETEPEQQQLPDPPKHTPIPEIDTDMSLETGSVIDNGSESEHHQETTLSGDEQEVLQDSFVGSEIDWNQKS